MLKRYKKAKGFTMIELVVAIGVLGILYAVASKSLNNTNMTESYRLQTALDRIASETVKYASGKPFTGVSMTVLCADQYLDVDICGASNDGTGTNPWAGNYTVQVSTSSVNRFTIRATAVPTNVGPTTAKYYKDAAKSSQYTSASKQLELIYGT
jgi:prepilin-type N-terminal cleavage/methylation domain-containing protein